MAIHRATHWVFIRIYRAKTAVNARRFLCDLEQACLLRIRPILTQNAKKFTNRLFGLRKPEVTGKRDFDQLCAEFGINRRLSPPAHTQTDGMVQRFKGRVEEALQSPHFQWGQDLETTLHRYVPLYNQKLQKSALGSNALAGSEGLAPSEIGVVQERSTLPCGM